MAIRFHCEHCGREISAPDTAGGKKGKCPACKQVVYIPAADADDVLDLAPIDQTEEQRRQQKIEEDLRRERELLLAQKSSPPPQAEDPPVLEDPHAEGGVVLPEIGATVAGGAGQVSTDLIVQYIQHMIAGRLEGAQAVLAQLNANPRAAHVAIDRLAGDEVAAARLKGVPKPVLDGFLRQLLKTLK